MYIVLTKWHEENPNDWVALDRSKGQTYTNDLDDPRHHILIDRDMDLLALRTRVGEREVCYGKAWGLGIGKDYPIEQQTLQ